MVDAALESAHQVVREHPAFYGVLGTVKQLPVGPQQLGNGFGSADAVFRRKHLFRRPFVGECALVFHNGHTPHRHQAANLALNPHIGQTVAHGGIFAHPVAFNVVFLHPVHDVLIPLDGNQVAGSAHPVQVEAHRPHIPALVFLPQHTGSGDAHILKESFVGAGVAVGSPQGRRRVVLYRPQRAHRDARRVHRNEKNADAPVPRRVGIRARHQVNVRGVVGGGGVHLLPVDDILVAVAYGAALQARQVGPRLGFGEAQRKGNFAPDDAGQELPLLLLAAGGQDGGGAGARAAHRDADAGELLLHNVLVNPAAVLPAVLPGPGDANPAPFRDFAVQLAGFGAAPPHARVLQLGDDLGGYIVGDELLHFRAQGFLFGRECEFHSKLASPGLINQR